MAEQRYPSRHTSSQDTVTDSSIADILADAESLATMVQSELQKHKRQLVTVPPELQHVTMWSKDNLLLRGVERAAINPENEDP